MSSKLLPIKTLSSWRKLALANWKNPADPQVYGTLEVDATRALELIEKTRLQAGGARLTVTHLVGRAVALAIAEEPDINGRISWGRILKRDTVDIFFQVATEGGRDLSGAKIDGVDRMSAVELASILASHADRIRTHKDPLFESTRRLMQRLPVPVLKVVLKLSGMLVNDLDLDLKRFSLPRDPFGSAMVTNVGGFDLETGFAPLVPMSRVPLVILVGAVRERPTVVNGQIVPRPILTLCATFDHRLIDGFQAGRMAATIKRYFADPELHEPSV